MCKEIFFTTTFWSFSGGKWPSVVLPHRIILQNPWVFAPKVPSRGHSSELKKSKGTGAERFSASHLLQKSSSALGEAVKGWQRPFQGRWILVFFFLRCWWGGDLRRVCQVKYQYALRDFCLQSSGGAFVSDEAQKMDCLKLLQRWSAVGTHRLQRGSAVRRVASEERTFLQLHARRSRHSTQRKWTCKWSPEGKNGCLGF